MKYIRKNLKYIFPVLIVIMVLGLVLSRIYQPDNSPPEPEIRISASEANEHIGKAAEVCGTIVSVNYIAQLGGKPTFINFGRPHPNQLFTAVIWGNNRPKWDVPPERHYINKNICVRGRIEIHDGTPQIVVKHPEQITDQEAVQ